ncbi:signal recognition particle-docking protein FtsY [Guggenheimella bovis]
MFKNLIDRFKENFTKTRDSIAGSLDKLFGNYDHINEDFLEELEEVLILSDVGFETTEKIMEKLRDLINERKADKPEEVKPLLEEILIELIDTPTEEAFDLDNPPKVILVIGVNGAGKTTSIGKLAKLLKTNGKKVVIAAADTFRAAAIDQVQVWADRAEVELVRHEEGSDPASVIYDAIQSSRAKKTDVLICDSAGRLHNKKNLMEELKKIVKIITREYPREEIRTVLVLDSTTGQNAVNQAVLFKEYADMDGIILTKMDGTSKGGFVFNIKEMLDIPVLFITLGEQIDDIAPFDATSFVRSILE